MHFYFGWGGGGAKGESCNMNVVETDRKLHAVYMNFELKETSNSVHVTSYLQNALLNCFTTYVNYNAFILQMY